MTLAYFGSSEEVKASFLILIFQWELVPARAQKTYTRQAQVLYILTLTLPSAKQIANFQLPVHVWIKC